MTLIKHHSSNILVAQSLAQPWRVLRRVSAALGMLLLLSHCAAISTLLPVTEPSVSAPTEVQAEPNAVAHNATATAVTSPTVWPALTADLAERYQQAKTLMRQQDYAGASQLLQPLAEAVPAAAGIRYNLALCYWQLAQTEAARLQLTQLLELRPDYVAASNLLGVIARQAGHFRQAERHWLAALNQQADYADAHKNLGFLYELYLQQPEQARYHYTQYQQLTGDPLAEAWLSLLPQQE
ncbi:tetratricopeptide repeat protein [Alishewanella sp. 16-MA]|uniref:Tetratricopeptide repeat protein n=1 Tax=Alishewanella maricola TaxID=2795740 RepID=A0ABS8C042_9ALTE|nr:tetratricopeptide repeat protein [Alishewanella maricola]MCB5225553.1 tetratricopeptide repeat protein [Alishewanella maricola]